MGLSVDKLKFIGFCAFVLGVPALLMSQSDPQRVELGKLIMITSPATLGLLLNWGTGDRGTKPVWRGVWVAGGVSLAILAVSVAIAMLSGHTRFGGPPMAPHVLGTALGTTLLTSVLEELGWAAGGLALAIKALGRRAGVLILGLVWACWHLVPTYFKVGLFPDLEAASAANIITFVITCVIYREMLTILRERAQTWLAAAVAHALPNLIFAVLIGLGIQGFGAKDWPLTPVPGGSIFLVVVGLVVVFLSRRRSV